MSETEARDSDDATPDATPTPPRAGPRSRRTTRRPAETPEDETPEDAPDEGAEPSWWHRSHPTFAGLVGFFTGRRLRHRRPGCLRRPLGLFVSDATAQKLFPLVLVALVIPIALLFPRKTRRFAQFMFLGIVSTVLVVAVTATLVIWVMIQIDG